MARKILWAFMELLAFAVLLAVAWMASTAIAFRHIRGRRVALCWIPNLVVAEYFVRRSATAPVLPDALARTS
jgi:hypothetical protein